jgi:hypothetical protein
MGMGVDVGKVFEDLSKNRSTQESLRAAQPRESSR